MRLSNLGQKIKRKVVQPLITPLYVDYNHNYESSIFLAGTERSGTTWVSEIINCNSEYRYIFEPFWPARVDICQRFRPQQYLRIDNNDPYYLHAAETILTGNIRNKWTDKYHRRFIANKRLIKDVRANLFLKWMSTHFPNMPIILLIRHPCAVVSSQLRSNHRFPTLEEEFLSQEELMQDFLHPYQKNIEQAETEFEKRIFRWCIQNYVPLKQFKEGEIHLAFYENFCEKPEFEIDRLFSFLEKDYGQKVFTKLKSPSPQSHADSAIVSGNSLIDGWRRWVTDEQVKQAIDILALFGLDAIYSQDSMPNPHNDYLLVKSRKR